MKSVSQVSLITLITQWSVKEKVSERVSKRVSERVDVGVGWRGKKRVEWGYLGRNAAAVVGWRTCRDNSLIFNSLWKRTNWEKGEGEGWRGEVKQN